MTYGGGEIWYGADLLAELARLRARVAELEAACRAGADIIDNAISDLYPCAIPYPSASESTARTALSFLRPALSFLRAASGDLRDASGAIIPRVAPAPSPDPDATAVPGED